MKYMYQFAIILLITFIGETLNYLIDLPIPASIYGLIIMTLLLTTKIIKLEQVRDAGKFLISIMQLMFIPGAAALIISWDSLSQMLVPFIVMVVSSTIIVMVVTGKVSDFIILRKSGDK